MKEINGHGFLSDWLRVEGRGRVLGKELSVEAIICLDLGWHCVHKQDERATVPILMMRRHTYMQPLENKNKSLFYRILWLMEEHS